MNDLIKDIVEKIRKKDIVLWVGAGFSLYAGLPSGSTLNQLLKNKFFTDEQKEADLSNSSSLDITSRKIIFRNSKVQNNKSELYEYLKELFVKTNQLIDVHKVIMDIPYIENIITTNYDNLFELAFGDNINSIYNDETYLLAQDGKVNLYKIHGDFRDYSTIILTNDDYANIYYKGIDSLIWTKIKDLVATKTILFIGFSFEDIDITTMINKIIDIVGDKAKCNFFISPSIDSDKVQYLKSKSIHCIEMSGEDIIKEIDTRIKQVFFQDIESGKMSYDKAIAVTKSKGFLPEVQSVNGNLHISSLKSTGQGVKSANGVITFSNDKSFIQEVNDFVTGKRLGELKIPSNVIKGLFTEIAGYTIHNITNMTNFKMVHHPDSVIDGYLFYDNFILPEKVLIKYYSSSHAYLTTIEHKYFKITYEVKIGNKNATVSFEYNIQSNSADIFYITLKEIRRALQCKNVFLVMPNSDEKINLLPATFKQKNKKLFNNIYILYSHSEKLCKIQKYFNIIIDVEKDIYDTQVKLVDRIYNAINEEYFLSLSQIDAVFRIEEKPIEIMLEEIKEKCEIQIIDERIELYGYIFILKEWYIAPCSLKGIYVHMDECGEKHYTLKNINGSIDIGCNVYCEKSQIDLQI